MTRRSSAALRYSDQSQRRALLLSGLAETRLRRFSTLTICLIGPSCSRHWCAPFRGCRVSLQIFMRGLHVTVIYMSSSCFSFQAPPVTTQAESTTRLSRASRRGHVSSILCVLLSNLKRSVVSGSASFRVTRREGARIWWLSASFVVTQPSSPAFTCLATEHA